MAIAIRTHTLPSQWELEEPEAILTALRLFDEQDRKEADPDG